MGRIKEQLASLLMHCTATSAGLIPGFVKCCLCAMNCTEECGMGTATHKKQDRRGEKCYCLLVPSDLRELNTFFFFLTVFSVHRNRSCCCGIYSALQGFLLMVNCS